MAKWLLGLCILLSCLVVVWLASPALADPLKSAHYQFDESELGGTSLLNSSSPDYKATGAGAVLGVGNSASTNYQVNAGHETTGAPSLSVGIINANASFGAFSPSEASVATSSFEVTDYTSYGYIVQIVGNPPSNGNHAIAAMSTAGPSQTGTEQFGINLVANTLPTSVGANPDYGQFGTTTAKPTTNYDTPNSFYYSNGDTIVQSPKSSGAITYTITYLVNVSSHTVGGSYTGNLQIVCIATY